MSILSHVDVLLNNIKEENGCTVLEAGKTIGGDKCIVLGFDDSKHGIYPDVRIVMTAKQFEQFVDFVENNKSLVRARKNKKHVMVFNKETK